MYVSIEKEINDLWRRKFNLYFSYYYLERWERVFVTTFSNLKFKFLSTVKFKNSLHVNLQKCFFSRALNLSRCDFTYQSHIFHNSFSMFPQCWMLAINLLCFNLLGSIELTNSCCKQSHSIYIKRIRGVV